MISYCIVAYRPVYARILIDDLIKKTTVSYEILVWLNVDDPTFEAFIKEKQGLGTPLKVVGKSENIGMNAFEFLFDKAQGDMVVQLDDDVIAISRRAAEIANDIFLRHPSIGVIGGHVWQDAWTTGGRPPLDRYLLHDHLLQLYRGPIDGGFTIYRKSLTHLAHGMRKAQYFALGVEMVGRASEQGYSAFLCPRILMFHVTGPIYSSHFGMLDFEVEKYRNNQRLDMVREYEEARATLPPPEVITQRIMEICHAVEVHQS